jgi:predicted DNA-binding transcriptional regulator AlpA
MTISTARPGRLLTRREVALLLHVSATTVARLERRGDFPPARLVSPRCRRWAESEVLAWLRARSAVAS